MNLLEAVHSLNFPPHKEDYTETILEDIQDPSMVITLKEDTWLVIKGVVSIKAIITKGCNFLIITGDGNLSCDTDDYIAIGVPIVRDMSYGRYKLPDSRFRCIVDIPFIHTSCKLDKCGIGVCGRWALESKYVTNTCAMCDTPLDMQIFNEPIYGSTKRSKDPLYLTATEREALNIRNLQAFEERLLLNLAQNSLVEMVSNCLKSDSVTYVKSLTGYLIQLFRRIDAVTYSSALQRISGSYVKALLNCEDEDIAKMDIRFMSCVSILENIAIHCELKIFDKIAVYPLAYRYAQVLHDESFTFFLEHTTDAKQQANFEELHLNEALIANYNHTTNRDYTKSCFRSFYGSNIYNKWVDCYNELVTAKDVKVIHEGTSNSGQTIIGAYGSNVCFKDLYPQGLYNGFDIGEGYGILHQETLPVSYGRTIISTISTDIHDVDDYNYCVVVPYQVASALIEMWKGN